MPAMFSAYRDEQVCLDVIEPAIYDQTLDVFSQFENVCHMFYE
jgi:hypothetical protein